MSSTLVIDASVSLGWILKEQQNSAAIESLFGDIAVRKVNAVAPTVWLYEMLNGLKTAVLRKRITKIRAKKKIPDVLATLPELFEFTQLVDESFQIAIKYGLSIYDASYVSLAKQKRCKFFTGDQNLYEKVKNKLKYVLPISEYKGVTI